mmetsp:Transcript_45881/g.74869  ORF Transcript_45881/g.74869 Transcript_45881/m.74869 type:complete len:113 (+) Transcript_45881:91-429(+)|eukprot:CAMPEP_0184643324 /NCGR_PEP_ID=MMETSP0308-20130426/141_1 /TAXON_ID=38269 /ORGANISM="Gloeochaete witrockiana, Strain SAG 46.84" /LENGTH=112 /DNA_ID=CAMNT_0027071167 /DNA_START=87 /DNA_END=425 /DNA_ORIENTATION=-
MATILTKMATMQSFFSASRSVLPISRRLMTTEVGEELGERSNYLGIIARKGYVANTVQSQAAEQPAFREGDSRQGPFYLNSQVEEIGKETSSQEATDSASSNPYSHRCVCSV